MANRSGAAAGRQFLQGISLEWTREQYGVKGTRHSLGVNSQSSGKGRIQELGITILRG